MGAPVHLYPFPLDHLTRQQRRIIEQKRKKLWRSIERATGYPPVVVSREEYEASELLKRLGR